MSEDRSYVWLTARRIKPGMMQQFKDAWSPGPSAAREDPYSGSRRTYFFQDASDENRMIGLGIFVSKEAYDHFAAAAIEDDRRFLMSQYVEEVEEERFFWSVEY